MTMAQADRCQDGREQPARRRRPELQGDTPGTSSNVPALDGMPPRQISVP
jgi:hypothetical protein